MSGTETVTLPRDLAPGERFFIDFSEFAAGPQDKKGFLKKRGPFEGVVFDSYTSVRLNGKADNMESPVPADSARTLDSSAVQQYVALTNPSTNSTTIAAGSVEIILFGDAGDRAQSLQFSGQAIVSDLIPGVTTTTHGDK